MMVAVTGASGFIGRQVSAALQRKGHKVIRLSRCDASTPWSLGEVLPDAASRIDALVHLASASLVARTDLDSAAELDARGTKVLLENLRELRKTGRRVRLVFVSSQSAGPRAINSYGRSKWEIEAMLTETDEYVVRPGLVYDDAFSHGAASALVGLTRWPMVVLPRIRPVVQPIHIEDLCSCIVNLVAENPPEQSLYCVGSERPLELEAFLDIACKKLGCRRPTVILVDPSVVRFIARIFDAFVPRSRSFIERVNGLLGLSPMQTAPSLKRLSVSLRPLHEDRSSIVND